MPVKSQAQAGWMGLVASGKVKKKGLSSFKAKEFLRGVKVSALPNRLGRIRPTRKKGGIRRRAVRRRSKARRSISLPSFSKSSFSRSLKNADY